MLKLLKPETRGIIRENTEEIEEETRSFYTPTKSVRISSTQNDPIACRNMVTGVLTDSTNQPNRTKARSQSQPTSKERPIVARTLFASEKGDSTTLPMPKALTASLPTFDGKRKNLNYLKTFFVTTSKCIHTSRKYRKSTISTPYFEETHYKLSATSRTRKRTRSTKS